MLPFFFGGGGIAFDGRLFGNSERFPWKNSALRLGWYHVTRVLGRFCPAFFSRRSLQKISPLPSEATRQPLNCPQGFGLERNV